MQALAPRDGKPLIINLWATWCGPCQTEMPVLANAQARYPGLNLVFVNQAERRNTVDAFIEALKLHIANSLFDPDLSVAKATHTTAYPTTLFYDASGRLLERHLGVRLFNRTTRSVSLTDAGRKFVEQIGPALRDIHDAMDAARSQQETPSGTLRINAFATADQTRAAGAGNWSVPKSEGFVTSSEKTITVTIVPMKMPENCAMNCLRGCAPSR